MLRTWLKGGHVARDATRSTQRLLAWLVAGQFRARGRAAVGSGLLIATAVGASDSVDLGFRADTRDD